VSDYKFGYVPAKKDRRRKDDNDHDNRRDRNRDDDRRDRDRRY
jgi:hypothetical protein